ncbi:MAG: hypothetical protein EZS28_020815 [Streblomastix strix]|uniref:SPRY domain-containing protein n=1 Tax=Streblomastix strix TaxID=222440 RepID=A0A5J4VMW4_9EUKA|nr:MAG: hypothetical protein EZS28_020815 [Streblomastix strix]
MDISTYRPDQTTQSVSITGSDAITIIPCLIQDLESDATNLHIPALRELLNIIVDNRENKDLTSKYKINPLMNKFTGSVEKNEEYVLSTTILHVIGVRNGTDDKIILAGAATDSIIQTIFSPDEKTSKLGSKALCDLIEENEIIQHSLMTTGFISKVQYAIINNQQSSSSSSSSSQTESVTPYHVKCGLLDVLLKLITTCDDLQPTSILIPVLNELKNNKDKNLKKKSENILGLLNSKGINSASSESSREKDEQIQQLEESNGHKEELLRLKEEEIRRKDQELRIKDEELQREKRRADEAEQKIRRLEQEKEKEKQEKEKKEAELKKLNEKPIIAIHNPDPTDIEFADVDGTLKRISKKQQKSNTVSLTQVLEDGIWSFEAEFNNTQDGYCAIGIIKDSYNIQPGEHPHSNQHNFNLVTYGGKRWHSGNVFHKQNSLQGNLPYSDNQTLKLECDSEKGTLIFFVDGKQQPVYISGIKEKVRFIVYMYYAGSSCQIRSLKKLAAPTSGHVASEQAVQW